MFTDQVLIMTNTSIIFYFNDKENLPNSMQAQKNIRAIVFSLTVDIRWNNDSDRKTPHVVLFFDEKLTWIHK